MSNSFFKLLLLSLVGFIFFSCTEDGVLEPSSTFTVNVDESAIYSTNDFEVGEMVSISVNITAEDGITIFGIDKVVNGGAAQSITTDFQNLPSPGATSFEATYAIPVNEAVGDRVQVIVKATAGSSSTFTSSSYTYDVVAQGLGGGGGVFPLLRSQVTVALGSQGNATTGSYLNTSNGTVYLNTEVENLNDAQKAAIDITFGVLNSTTPTIISPDARQGLTFNNPMGASASTTTFRTQSTVTNLDNVTSSGVENDIDHSTGAVSNTSISNNGVYSFVNEAGAKGYFKVTSITGSGNSQVATLDVLVQTIQ